MKTQKTFLVSKVFYLNLHPLENGKASPKEKREESQQRNQGI